MHRYISTRLSFLDVGSSVVFLVFLANEPQSKRVCSSLNRAGARRSQCGVKTKPAPRHSDRASRRDLNSSGRRGIKRRAVAFTFNRHSSQFLGEVLDAFAQNRMTEKFPQFRDFLNCLHYFLQPSWDSFKSHL